MPSSSLSSAGNPPPIGTVLQIATAEATGEASLSQDEEREMKDILPLELWSEILVRLPVRPLLTLKCVSKSYLSLIQNPNFTFLHFTRFNNEFYDPNPSRLQLLLVESPNWGFGVKKKFVTLPRNLFHRRNPTANYEEIFECGDFNCNVIGYINGLLLMNMRHPTLRSKDKIILWNPSIRKSLTIPMPRAFDAQLRRPILGFGYDSVSDDYKIVSFVYRKLHANIEVYNLKVGSWRTIWEGAIGTFGALRDKAGVFVNGAIHWISMECNKVDNIVTLSGYYVVSFHLGSELFSNTTLPKGVDWVKFLLEFDGSFGVFSLTFNHVCLWVMRESGWSKEYETDLHSYPVDHLLNRINEARSSVFSDKNCELLITTFESLLSIDTKTKNMVSYNIRATSVATYTESLLWMAATIRPKLKETKHR